MTQVETKQVSESAYPAFLVGVAPGIRFKGDTPDTVINIQTFER